MIAIGVCRKMKKKLYVESMTFLCFLAILVRIFFIDIRVYKTYTFYSHLKDKIDHIATKNAKSISTFMHLFSFDPSG